MRQALSELFVQIESIERTIELHDQLIAFGQTSQDCVLTVGADLHRIINTSGRAVLQPVLNGAVLLIAAAFEQFVTDTIIEFSDNLPNMVPEYEYLPERIRSSNERMTGQAIGDNRFRNRFGVYEHPRFVENLRNCQAGITPYSINGEALALHNSNLKPEMLSQLMGRLDLRGVWSLASCTETLREWSNLEASGAIETNAKSRLEELIDTRNQIAHRVGIVNPGPDIVRSFVEFVRALGQSLVAVLSDHADSLASEYIASS